jgi:methylmalonyl-CoA mutase C-terminal domain/subunit
MNTNDTTQNRIKVLVAKPGLDGHDRGAKVLVHALREAGMEILYTGLHKTIDDIVHIAAEDKLVLVGGNIPHKDVDTLKGFGVQGVFPTGSNLDEIIQFIKEKART